MEEAADARGVSRDSFERHVMAELSLLRVGRRLLIPAKELERWIDREMAIPLVACEICDGGSPVLDYHDLMKHSVLARQAEIEEWEGIDLPEAAKQLAEDKDRFEADLEAADLPRPIRTPAWRATHHLDRWIGALETLAEDNED